MQQQMHLYVCIHLFISVYTVFSCVYILYIYIYVHIIYDANFCNTVWIRPGVHTYNLYPTPNQANLTSHLRVYACA